MIELPSSDISSSTTHTPPTESHVHEFINPKFHFRQRITCATLFTVYLVTNQQNITLIDSQLLTISLFSLYTCAQLAASWFYEHHQNHSKITHMCISGDLLFAGYCLVQDPAQIPLGLVYLFSTLLNNGCQHGQYHYNKAIAHAIPISFASSICQLALTQRTPSLEWLVLVVFLSISTFAISFFFFQIQEIKRINQQDHDLDPDTGVLTPSAFDHAAHLAMELRVQTPNQLVFMLIEVEKNQLHANDPLLKSRHLPQDTLRHFIKLLHINFKPNDIIGRYKSNLFAFVLSQSAPEEAEAIGLALQHEFALWAEKNRSEKWHLSIAICPIPNFQVSVSTLVNYTFEGLFEARKLHNGAPGVTVLSTLSH
jgi:GGDEF domain-containing protein